MLVNEDPVLLRRILEGALLSTGEALSIERMLSLFDEEDQPEKDAILEALAKLQEESEKRGVRLIEVASGWRYQASPELAPWINRLWEEKPQKYSRALLETLALIAYRQPLTRGDIEEVRGVAVSSHIIKTLAEREWIKVVGQRDVPGRPSLYATTRQFLDYFGLKSLDELPSLSELKDIDGLNQDLDLNKPDDSESDQIAEAKLQISEEQEAEIEAREEQKEFADALAQTLRENELQAQQMGDEDSEETIHKDTLSGDMFAEGEETTDSKERALSEGSELESAADEEVDLPSSGAQEPEAPVTDEELNVSSSAQKDYQNEDVDSEQESDEERN